MEYELIDTGECQARALVRVHVFVHRGCRKGLVWSFAVSVERGDSICPRPLSQSCTWR